MRVRSVSLIMIVIVLRNLAVRDMLAAGAVSQARRIEGLRGNRHGKQHEKNHA